MVLSPWVAIAVALAAGGCVQSTESRDCLVFDHPALQEWRSESDGETLVFTSPDGASAIYTVEPLMRNVPYTVTVDSLDGPAGCTLTAEHVLRADDDSHSIRLTYLQADAPGRPSTEDPLTVTVTVSVELAGDPGAVPSTLSVPLTGPRSRIDFETEQSSRTFSERLTLADGREYMDVFEREERSGSLLLSNPNASPLGLERFALARGVGLVEIERLSGVPFTRIP